MFIQPGLFNRAFTVRQREKLPTVIPTIAVHIFFVKGKLGLQQRKTFTIVRVSFRNGSQKEMASSPLVFAY